MKNKSKEIVVLAFIDEEDGNTLVRVVSADDFSPKPTVLSDWEWFEEEYNCVGLDLLFDTPPAKGIYLISGYLWGEESGSYDEREYETGFTITNIANLHGEQFGRELWLACYLYATNPFYIDVDTSGMDEKRLIEEWNKHYSEYISEQHFGYDKGVNSEEYGITRNQ